MAQPRNPGNSLKALFAAHSGRLRPDSTRFTFANVADPRQRETQREADYRLAAAGREAEEDERLDLLEQLYDPATRRRRAELVQSGVVRYVMGGGRGFGGFGGGNNSVMGWVQQNCTQVDGGQLYDCAPIA